jgi:SecD/SecF fusion protein
MVDKISRKITFLLGLTVLSVLSLLLVGFRFGLDLQGGTRLVYSVDFEKAVEEGVLTQDELVDRNGLVTNLINIWRERIDPTGVRGVTIRSEGSDRIVIELPGSASTVSGAATAGLAEDAGDGDQALVLDGSPEALGKFPEDGGIVEIDGEKIRYGVRRGSILSDLSRGLDGTQLALHAQGASVSLQATDPWRARIENTGRMNFLIQAESSDLADPDAALSSDVEKERATMTTWVQDHPGVPIAEYNRLLTSRPGPVSRLRWYPMRGVTEEAIAAPLEERVQALIVESNPDWQFEGGDLRTVFQSVDDLGLPAVGFEMNGPRQSEFGDFTEEHENKLMAIVINDEIVSMPNIEEKLPGRGIIRGQFTSREVQDLIQVLRSGSLKIAPTFEAQETVGATLGNDYVRRGAISAIIGLAAVLLFALVYYQRLGMVAAVSLLFNLVALMGAMAFIQATLTLPGVAGIILTVGMAVDANILIYERIREEQARGRKPLQSARDGFANAFSTIVDANLTTLITGLILMKVGTGPVRGFATTLCIGIVTSMISALVLSKLLVHFQLEKGVSSWSMRRLVGETRVAFMAKRKVAAMASLALCAAGLVGFVGTPDDQKLGIDFLGGTTMVVRTAEPQTAEGMRALFDPAQNPNLGQATNFTRSAEISPILNSASGEGYTSFRINSKGKNDGENLADIRSDVETWLQSVLSGGPVEDLVNQEGAVSGVLYTEANHSTTDLAAGLAKVGIEGATVTESAPGVYGFSGTTLATSTVQELGNRLQIDLAQFKDEAGNNFNLASPIGELNSVGAQVVSELRDQAVAAILLSLFAAVMYIRMRFAEYSYGFAAVIALVHDVIIALGAVALAIATGLVQVEINLAMIAAFLTIIGYSLNDTIVIFDRVRENLPRMKGSLSEILDVSINQTLSRTLLTSITTLITVLLLFLFNAGTGNVIEGFSFALIIGVLSGTYSTIFIACPALLWLETRRLKKGGAPIQAPETRHEPAAAGS